LLGEVLADGVALGPEDQVADPELPPHIEEREHAGGEEELAQDTGHREGPAAPTGSRRGCLARSLTPGLIHTWILTSGC